MFNHKSTDQLRTEARRKIARMCKRETLFRLVDDKAGDWRTVKAPFAPDVEKYLADKYGERLEVIANKDLDVAVSFVGAFSTVDNRFSKN